MPTEPTRAPGNPPEASDGRRLHIHGIKDASRYDAEVVTCFEFTCREQFVEADLAAH
jgi:hypothetical protein